MKSRTAVSVGIFFAFTLNAKADFISFDEVTDPSIKILSAEITPPSPRAVLGQGFDIIRNELRGDCVKGNGHDHKEGTKGSRITDTEYINTVSDMQTYDKASGDSFSLGFTYKLFTFGINDGFHEKDSFNGVNAVARFYRRIVTQIDSRNDGVWEDSPAAIVDQGLDDPAVLKRFTEVCGTHFISAIYRGDIVSQSVRFNVKKASYTAEGKTGIEAALTGIFKLGYTSEEAETKVNEHSDYTVSRVGEQGLIGKQAPLPTPGTSGELLGLARYIHGAYSDQVAEAEPSTSAIIGIEILPYWRINLPGHEAFGRWQDDAFDSLKANIPSFQRVVSIQGDIEFAKNMAPAELTIFYDETEGSLQAKAIIANSLIQNFSTAMEACYQASQKNDEGTAKQLCGQTLTAALPESQIQGATLKHR